MRAELTQNRVRIGQAAGLHVLFRIDQCLVKRGAVSLVEPISAIEGQKLDFGSFRQIGEAGS